MNAMRRHRGIVAIALALTIVSAAAAKYSGGTGEPNDPYQIATAADLMALGEEPNDYDRHFILTADIDLDPNLPGRKVFDRAVIAPAVLVCPRTYCRIDGKPFVGSLDGNGRTISHIVAVGGDFVGLFGYLGTEGEIRNLEVVDVNVSGSGGGVGGLAGHSDGTIAGCRSTGVVKNAEGSAGGLVGGNGGHITNCDSTVAVRGRWNVGGLVGGNGGLITSSYSTGAVMGGGYVGGLLGVNGGVVTQCHSASVVNGVEGVGGLVGCNGTPLGEEVSPGDIIGCYSTGSVDGNDRVGGLVGQNDYGTMVDCYTTGAVRGSRAVGGLAGYNDQGSMIRCYSTGAVSGADSVGGLVGYAEKWSDLPKHFIACSWDMEASCQVTSDGGTGRSTSEMHDPNTFQAMGWDFVGQPDGPHDIWGQPAGGGYPILWWQQSPLPRLPAFSGGTGESDAPYQLSTPAELDGIGYNPRLMNAHFELVNDVDMAGLDFHTIGSEFYPFIGSFNGNGHTISHLSVNGGSYVGLFGQLEAGATVTDLGVADVNIVGSGFYVGGLVGMNGTSSFDMGFLSRCYSTGVVGGSGQYVGGLVGYNNGDVTNCYSGVAVAGEADVGGLVGWNAGTVDQCYSRGLVSGRTVVGGLVGFGWSPGVTSGFWDIQISGQTHSRGGTGLTTVEMQTVSTFLEAGWDFVGETANGTEDIWWIDEGKDYPRLWREPRPAARLPVIKLDATTFDAAIAEGVVLVDFFAMWCSHCMTQAFILEEVADRLEGKSQLAKLDIDKVQSVAQRYGVAAIPTLILFQNGVEIERFVGVTSADVLVAAILATVDSM